MKHINLYGKLKMKLTQIKPVNKRILLLTGGLVIAWTILLFQWAPLFSQYLVVRSITCQGNQAARLSLSAHFLIQSLHYPSVQMAYRDNTGAPSTCTAGWEGVPILSVKINANTPLQYASTSKLFTADLLLALVRQQRIQLDDKLVDKLPEWHAQDFQDSRIPTITMAQLLSHRAGFDWNHSPDPMFTPHPFCPYRLQQFTHYHLDYTPNEKMVYANVGYCLLGEVIARAYQQPYATVLSQHPAWTHAMHLVQPTADAPPKLPRANQQQTKIANIDYYALTAAGGMIGNAQDLADAAQYMAHQAHPNITDKPSDIACHHQVINGCHGYAGYEYQPDARLQYIWRSGSLPSVSAWVILDSEGGSLAILSNYRREGENPLWLTERFIQHIYQTHLSYLDKPSFHY